MNILLLDINFLTSTLSDLKEFQKCSLTIKRGWDKSPSLSIVFGLSSKTQWLSGLYYADFISIYSPTQLCGGGTTKSNSNELPISVPLSVFRLASLPDQSCELFDKLGRK